MKRRSFLKSVGSTAAGTSLALQSVARGHATDVVAEVDVVKGIPRRSLGNTGLKASIIAFPGLALGRNPQDVGTEKLHDAYERGVNYFDVAPAYGDSEVKMGIALEGIQREGYLLACKTKMRDKKGAREELERSLKRLKTDYFDVYQLHCLKRTEEVEEALAPGGAMETILEAKKEGKIRHIGFSAHTTKSALAAMRQFEFETVMFPITFVEYYLMGFGKPILELAKKQGAGVLAMKMLCRGAWPEGVERTRKWWYRATEDIEELNLAVRFSLSQPNVVAGICPSFFDLLDKSIEAGKTYKPITEGEKKLLRKTAETCQSLFRREQQVASTTHPHDTVNPESPHECCFGKYA